MTNKTEYDVFISIGSNIDPKYHVPRSISELDAAYGPLVCSMLYRTSAFGFEGSDFINGVVWFRSNISPLRLRDRLKALEVLAGRRHAGKPEDLELDLDLLLYGSKIIESGDLILPRPHMLDYAYILGSLSEIAPEFIHPITGHSFAWHWNHFSGEKVLLEPITINEI